MRRISLVSVVFSMACASAQPAATAEPTGGKQTDLDVAFELYQAERYKEAADAFARAYEQNGDASAIAGQAQSLQRAGECHEAAVLYERFLEIELDPTYDNAIRSMIDRCTTR